MHTRGKANKTTSTMEKEETNKAKNSTDTTMETEGTSSNNINNTNSDLEPSAAAKVTPKKQVSSTSPSHHHCHQDKH